MSLIKTVGDKIIRNAEQVVFGKLEIIRLALCCLVCEGHLLIEDVPGVGKTVLARSLALSLGSSYSRIQCTSDLLPSDVLGVHVYNQKSGEFVFRPGPIHHNIVLVDEINRAHPKTQSALLESMEERQVSIDGLTMPLPRPFMILSTQNPIEYDGTFPLPEAQLDRFFMRVSIGYPDFDSESHMLVSQQFENPLDGIKAVTGAEELFRMQQEVRSVNVDVSVRDYILKIVRATREDGAFLLGASPRGSLALFRASQAWAALEGRDFVVPEDVKKMAAPILEHRIKSAAGSRGIPQDSSLLASVLEKISVPV